MKKSLSKISYLSCVFVCLLFTLLLYQPPTSAKTTELRFAHIFAPGGPEDQIYQKWVKDIGEASGGSVKINIFPAATLVSPFDAYDAAASGLADLSMIVTNLMPGQFRLTNLADLPLMPEITGEMRGLCTYNLLDKFEEVRQEWADVHIVYVFDNTSQYILGTNVPIKTQDDLKGLKLRVAGGEPTALMKLMGAVPLQLPSGEIYTSMEKGVIDGWTLTYAGCVGMRLYEVTKYILDGGPNGELWAGPNSVVMNKNVWNKLPPEAKEAFNKFGGKHGAQMMLDAYYSAADKGKKLTGSKGVNINNLTPEEYERWRKIAEKVWEITKSTFIWSFLREQ